MITFCLDKNGFYGRIWIDVAVGYWDEARTICFEARKRRHVEKSSRDWSMRFTSVLHGAAAVSTGRWKCKASDQPGKYASVRIFSAIRVRACGRILLWNSSSWALQSKAIGNSRHAVKAKKRSRRFRVNIRKPLTAPVQVYVDEYN